MVKHSAPNTNYLSSCFASGALRSAQTFGTLSGMKIGEAIRQIRKDRGLTLEEVAGEIGADTGNLSRVERGQQNHTPEMIDNLARVFGVRVSEIYALAEGQAATRPKPVNIANPVVADFERTYNNVNSTGKEVLRNMIHAVKVGYGKDKSSKSA